MKVAWLKGHTNKDERRKQVASYKNAYDELAKVIHREFVKKEAYRDYSDPGWQAKQIAINEYNAVVDQVLELIDLNQEES